LLAGVIQPEQLASIMSGLRSDSQRSVWLRLGELPETTLNQFLLKEHPQIAAYVLSKTGAGTAATILRQLPASLRVEVVRRILAMRRITDGALSVIEQSLQDELLVKVSKESGPAVHSRVADIINKMERHQMEEVLSDLEKHRPKDAKLVKGLLFTFDDISRLSPGDRVKLFDGVPSDRTIIALQNASPALKEIVLSSVSSRSRRMIEQEVSNASNIPPRDVIKARRAIADFALELAERGQIDIGQQQEEP
jgi:flagellar motor switch protein FliG